MVYQRLDSTVLEPPWLRLFMSLIHHQGKMRGGISDDMPTSSARRKNYQVPALKRAFAILDSLNQTSFGLTVQEIREQH